MSQTLANHSYVDLSQVGNDTSGSDSVRCYTDLESCCSATQGIHRGDWYFPDGNRLPFNGLNFDTYEVRLSNGVVLRRSREVNSPTVGIYRCDIATNTVHDDTDISVRDTVYVGLYTASGGNANWNKSQSLVEQDCHWQGVANNKWTSNIIFHFCLAHLSCIFTQLVHPSVPPFYLSL